MIKIFAVDIKNGKVVKAYAGTRLNYKPLKIKNKDFSDANLVIKKAISVGIKNIYIADLDSIENRKNNWYLIRKIVETNQKINFFFDSGFNRVSKLRDFNFFFKKNKDIKNITVVIGTEGISSLNLLNQLNIQFKSIISFDFLKKKECFVFSNQFSCDKFILMFIKQVGGRGINWPFLNIISKFISPKKCFVAGGIKYDGDIKKLKKLGYSGVIISSLIHKELI